MNDFEYEVWQRKTLARQARHRKIGSRSRKCSLPSDRMTNKQWNERCGDVVVYNLGRPMSWEELKGIPADMQKMYIESLIEKYGATASELAKMFGCTASTVTRFCKNPEIDIVFSVGKRMTREQQGAFAEFMIGETYCHRDSEQPIERDESGEEKSPMSMEGFSLSFSGKFDPGMIHNSISSMIPNGSNITIYIDVKFNL